MLQTYDMGMQIEKGTLCVDYRRQMEIRKVT